MRILFFAVLCTFTSLNAQDLNKRVYDSINALIDTTFLLNDQSEHGKALLLSNELLGFFKLNPDTLLLSKVYSSLSFTYTELGDKEKSLKYAFTAIELNKAIQDTIGLALMYNDLGVTYKNFGLKEKAKESFVESARYAMAYGADDISIYPFYNLGDLFLSFDKNYTEAEYYFLKSLSIVNDIKLNKSERFYVDLNISLGVVNHRLKRYIKSNEFFEKGFNIATKENYFTSLLDYYDQRAALYKDDENYIKTVSMLENSKSIRDSIEKIKQIEIVKRVETEYKIKESEEKIKLIEKESLAKEVLFQKSKKYNYVLIVLLFLLLGAVYYAFRMNKKLKISKNKAVRLTKVKSDFYSEISHELRTPLYAVIELSGLLLKENVSETHKEYLESLNFSANHLIALVNNVLELNKVESGKLHVELLNVDIERLFSNIINSLEYALLQSNNNISLFIDEDIPQELLGDSLKLSQVMINLISNAIKFTRNGQINVIVKKLSETTDGVHLYFEVSDNGMGISKENQKKIFKAYYQESYQSDNSFKGTGLGLPIVNRLLNVMGTQININSEINEGSKFFFELPFAYAKENSVKLKKEEVLLAQIKGLHFLVVDDNKINQLVTKKTLENLSITYDVASSGMEAIERTRNKKFDGILMDLHMPEMDGYVATQNIREFNTTIPIIAFTATNSEDIELRVKNSDMNAYIIKPFFTADFVRTINEVIT